MSTVTQANIDDLIKAVADKDGAVVVFRNTMPNCRFTLKNGKECIFLNGKYATDSVEEITELMLEIGAGNPHLFVDAKEMIVARAELDPMEALRAKIIAEFKASQAAIASKEADFGNTAAGKNTLNIASSTDVQAATSGSTSGGTGATIVPGPR